MQAIFLGIINFSRVADGQGLTGISGGNLIGAVVLGAIDLPSDGVRIDILAGDRNRTVFNYGIGKLKRQRIANLCMTTLAGCAGNRQGCTAGRCAGTGTSTRASTNISTASCVCRNDDQTQNHGQRQQR